MNALWYHHLGEGSNSSPSAKPNALYFHLLPFHVASFVCLSSTKIGSTVLGRENLKGELPIREGDKTNQPQPRHVHPEDLSFRKGAWEY